MERAHGIEVEKQGFQLACLITGQQFQGVGLRLTAFILTFRDPSSHLCQIIMRVAVLTDLELGSCSRIWDFSNPFGGEFETSGVGIVKTIFLREFEKWNPDMFPKSEISKISCSSHSKNVHIKLNLDS